VLILGHCASAPSDNIIVIGSVNFPYQTSNNVCSVPIEYLSVIINGNNYFIPLHQVCI
jgi:hypothetical protein